MKCVCGYENRNGEYDDSWNEIKESGEMFIEVEGHFTMTCNKNDYHERKESVHLFACPKCHTVQMKHSF